MVLVLLKCYLSLSFYLTIYAQHSALPARVLIYSATADYRHDSIPVAIEAITTRGPSINVQFDNTEDRTRFSNEGLAGYDALLFLDNTGEVLDEGGKEALQRYLDLGGNFVAIHAASDSLRNTSFYGQEVGAFFDHHPPIQNATINVIGPSHPSTSMLPARWQVQDEMYSFKSDPRSVGAVVVLSADESTYNDPGPSPNQGTPHPTAWFQERGAGVDDGKTAGRSFYTSLGHLNETWQDELFLAHVLGGISWTLQSNTTRAFNSSGQDGNGNSESSTTSTATAHQSTASHSSASSAIPSFALVFTAILSVFLSTIRS